MFIEVLAAILLGVHAGVITGLIPGIHVNLVALLLVAATAFLSQYINPLLVGIIIIACALTHTFLDFIPSVFLGAPDADTALSILPGHKLLLEGKAYEAVKLTVIGSLFCLIVSIMLMPLLIPTVKFIYPILKEYIGVILIGFMIYMIFKDNKKWWNLLIFVMSGVLGLIVLNIPNLGNPLFPLLSGLFGTSMLIISLWDKVNIPEQKISETIVIEKQVQVKALGASTIAGTLTSFFPGLGAAQGAVLATQMVKDIGDYGFMILVGGINTVNFILSLVTLLVIDKARNGAVLAVSQIIQVNVYTLIIFAAAALIIGGIATLLALNITRIFAKLIVKVNYRMLVISIITLITILTFYFSGFLGLLILFVATSIGIIPGEKGIARNHAMGCLILPVILYLL